mgnify:CR=1 FL=1
MVMVKKKVETNPPVEARPFTAEEETEYRAMLRKTTFGNLDNYFAMMMELCEITGKEKEVLELAVRAFINDLAHNGLPSIRRERYNRELAAPLMLFNLVETAREMSGKASIAEYHP